jgi:hypothetical protein
MCVKSDLIGFFKWKYRLVNIFLYFIKKEAKARKAEKIEQEIEEFAEQRKEEKAKEEEEIRLLREKRVGYLCSQVTHCTLFKWILGVSNFISTPAYLFQFEFICKLYMDNVLIKFENHIPPPKF